MFSRNTLALRNLRRATDPQNANINQRTGPTNNAIAAAIVGVGVAYFIWNARKADDAKTPKKDELKSNETVRASGGGASKIA